MVCFSDGGHGSADYVLEDREGIRRAVCGDCAGAALRSRRWVHVTPLEAVGEDVMAHLRQSGQEQRMDGADQ